MKILKISRSFIQFDLGGLRSAKVLLLGSIWSKVSNDGGSTMYFWKNVRNTDFLSARALLRGQISAYFTSNPRTTDRSATDLVHDLRCGTSNSAFYNTATNWAFASFLCLQWLLSEFLEIQGVTECLRFALRRSHFHGRCYVLALTLFGTVSNIAIEFCRQICDQE